MKLRTLSLFSGIGGLEKGLEDSGGFTTVAFCEMDKHCQVVLNKHWPDVKIHSNVMELKASDLPPIDVMTGGFPCQDISVGGRQRGIKAGTRSGLWKEYARLINELRPKYAIIENVGALRKNGLGIVLNDLAGLGYDAEWATITAESVGYPHQRERLFIIAYPSSQRLHEHSGEERHLQVNEEWPSAPSHIEGEERESESIEIRPVLSRGLFDSLRSPYSSGESAVSSIRRVTDGLPTGLDERRRKQRIKQLGNAVVPKIAEIIGRAIMEREKC